MFKYFFSIFFLKIFNVKEKIGCFKNIIPDLLSIETKLKRISGFYISDDFDFYQEISDKHRFHYQVVCKKNIRLPRKYEFRNGYFYKLGNDWFYERKIFGIIPIRFYYNQQNKTFFFNFWYNFIPFKIGGINPIGKHLADIINFNLFFAGIILINGCSFIYNNKIFCVLAPSFSGKTALVNDIIKKDGKYISENILVLNLESMEVYPTACSNINFGRKTQKTLSENLMKNNTINQKQKYNKILFFQNTQNTEYEDKQKSLLDFILLKSLFFLQNNFILSYIFINKLAEDTIDKIKFLSMDKNSPQEIIIINDYKYEKLFDYFK